MEHFSYPCTLQGAAAEEAALGDMKENFLMHLNVPTEE